MTRPKPQTVFRMERAARNFTTISNTLLQDSRLSHEARGLLAELLSRPDNWEITVRGIIATGPRGREKVYRMIREAQALGYITSEGQPRAADGTLGKSYYAVRDAPCAGKPDAAPCAAKPDTVKPETAKPHPANQPQQKTDSNKRQKEQNNTTAPGARACEPIEDQEGIRGPGFALPWPVVDAAAELIGAPPEKARQLARVMALEWMAAPPKPQASPVAIFRRALREEIAGGRTRRPSEARQADAKPHWRDEQRETQKAVLGAIQRARAAQLAEATP